jgi:hypothetical protein
MEWGTGALVEEAASFPWLTLAQDYDEVHREQLELLVAAQSVPGSLALAGLAENGKNWRKGRDSNPR